jgi:hypothetical protein
MRQRKKTTKTKKARKTRKEGNEEKGKGNPRAPKGELSSRVNIER